MDAGGLPVSEEGSRAKRLVRLLALVLALPALSAPGAAQQPPSERAASGETTADLNQRLEEMRRRMAVSGDAAPPGRAGYRIGPDDLLEITVFGAPELDRAVRVAASGEISLPLVGVVDVAGRTPHELERLLEERLEARYMRAPQVSVFVRELRSQGVTVLGAVRRPGVYQVPGRTTLVELLSLAEGLDDDAGDRVLVRRAGDAGSEPAEELNLAAMLAAAEPGTNPEVLPGDVVTVTRAGVVYVVGEVRKPGGYLLRGNESISVLQALALAEGLTRTAARGAARIIRTDPESGRREEIPVDLGRVLAGKAPDPVLAARDIVFVPNSAARGALYRGTEAAVSILSGLIIFRR
jgi:polysaccharide export outer membrane protein